MFTDAICRKPSVLRLETHVEVQTLVVADDSAETEEAGYLEEG